MKNPIYSREHARLVKKLKRARIQARLSQVEAAKRLQITQSYLSKMETGLCRIDVIELKKFARVYKKPIIYFLE